MDFFEEASVEELSEQHITSVRGLEDSEAKRILALFKKARVELRDRLDTLREGSFSAQQMRGTLFQIELAINEMTRSLGEEMKTGANSLATLGLKHLTSELNKWDKNFVGAVTPINFDAAVIAEDTSNFLFSKYETSLISYGTSLRSNMAQEITQGILQQQTVGQVVRRVGQVFLGEEWKLQQIVRTELHNVYNIGKMNGMEELQETSMPDLKKTLFHPMDSRTGKDSKRLAQNNPIVPIDEPFVENSTGKKLTYMAPPNRPNDRAILIPYRDSWS